MTGSDKELFDKVTQDINGGRWPFAVSEKEMRDDVAEMDMTLDLENQRQQLTKVGQELANAGYTVHWEAQSQIPALIVNEKCLLRVSQLSEGVVTGSFWHVTNIKLRDQLHRQLGNRIEFNPMPIAMGQPTLGEKIPPTNVWGELMQKFN